VIVSSSAPAFAAALMLAFGLTARKTTKVRGDRVTKCTTDAGRIPTFVSVDFYDAGDLFGVVRKTNGF
jgi:hypothetical protein